MLKIWRLGGGVTWSFLSRALLNVQEVMSGSVERSVYVGHDAQHMRGVLTLHYPMRNGVVSSWDQMEMVSF